MGDLQFRDATLADLPAVVGLLAGDTLGEQREDPALPLDPGYEAAFAAIRSDPGQRLIVAVLDGRVVGTMQLSIIPGIAFRGAWRGQIEAVRIAQALRGRGLGGELIAWAVEQFRQGGCKFVQLTSHKSREGAHRFYEQLGWMRSHDGFKLTLGPGTARAPAR